MLTNNARHAIANLRLDVGGFGLHLAGGQESRTPGHPSSAAHR
ncbi:MAG: hypothetical protein ACYDHX_12245 [Methanothrix sp.]